MLFNILKLFGLDVPARIAAARHDLERRVEDAAGQVKQAAAMGAMLAVLYAFAALAALLTCGVGLIALYRYVALTYGEFYGFAAVGGLLVIAAAIFFVAAMACGKSWAKSSAEASRIRREETERGLPNARRAEAQVADAGIHESGIDESSLGVSMPVDTTSDLIEPLAFHLSRVLKFPSTGNPVLDELVGHLRVAARETTDEAIERVARTVRYGNRSTLVVVLSGATFLGWLLARHGHLVSGRDNMT